MKLETSLSPRLRQELHLAPQIIQSIEILQMPALDLQVHVQKALAENEALEVSEGEEEGAAPGEADSPAEGGEPGSVNAPGPPAEAQEARERPPSESDPTLAELGRLEELAEDLRIPHGRVRGSDDDGDGKLEALQNAPDRPISLEVHLAGQFELLDLPRGVRAAGRAILQRLDHDGYLREPLETIVAAGDGTFTLEEAQSALGEIQGLDPRGIGARELRECLLLQLDPTRARDAFARLLVEKHLEDLSKNRLPKVSRETGRSIEDIEDALARIRSLDPSPGNRFRPTEAPVLRPDVSVEIVDGDPEVRVERSYVPRLRLNPQVRTLLERPDLDAQTREYLKRKVEAARWLMDAVEQRRSTLDRVAKEIVAHQRDFLEYGPIALRPLKMQDIADRLGIHVSTVSRAISEKAIATPRGVVPLKAFFTGSMGAGSAGDEGASRVSVRQRVQEIIEKEDPGRPLSDDDLATALREKGISIARRTVTKYRKMLGIPPASHRRKFGA